MQERYPILKSSSDDFCKSFSPAYPALYAMRVGDIAQAHEGATPTLAATSQVYGIEVTSMILSSWIKSINDFVGKGALSAPQVEELSILMIKSAWWLKLGEIALFIMNLKSGEYGKLYGNLNPLWIMETFQTFKTIRNQDLERHRVAKEMREREENRKKWAVCAATPEQISAIMAKFDPSVTQLAEMINHE